MMLSTIEQMSQNAVAHGPRDDELPKEDTRKGQERAMPRGTTSGEINVTKW
jgi:hypothetical protein